MEKNPKRLQRKFPFTGVGITFGAATGTIIGLLFIDGNIALGMGFGVSLGMILGSMADIRGGKIVYALTGMALGAGLGSISGLLLGLLHGAYDAAIQHGSVGPIFGLPFKNGYIILCVFIMAAIGLAIGTVVGAHKLYLENQTIA